LLKNPTKIFPALQCAIQWFILQGAL